MEALQDSPQVAGPPKIPVSNVDKKAIQQQKGCEYFGILVCISLFILPYYKNVEKDAVNCQETVIRKWIRSQPDLKYCVHKVQENNKFNLLLWSYYFFGHFRSMAWISST